jgi:Domain of unknown function (DUF4417)
VNVTNRNGRLRDDLRPHGEVSEKCTSCIFFADCGGIEPKRSLFKEDCFDRNCCNDGSCDNVCPYKGDFLSRCHEVGGLRFDDLKPIEQRPIPIPRYVPLIHHGYSRSDSLDCPVVALSTSEVFRLDKSGVYRPIAESAESLRSLFRLQASTTIILRGTAKDPPLERYWKYRRRDDAPRMMASLGVSLVVGPNFSHFLDVPRTDNLFNRKRQLICLGEMASAGLNPVPHLSAVMPGDWSFWKDYLRSNPSIRHVAVEFQTGNKRGAEGTKAVRRLSRLQDQLGRNLHPILIGAAQFLTRVACEFDNFTLIDSTPFMKAVKRMSFDDSKAGRAWVEERTSPGEPIDSLIAQNIVGYSAWVERRCGSVINRKEVPDYTMTIA